MVNSLIFRPTPCCLTFVAATGSPRILQAQRVFISQRTENNGTRHWSCLPEKPALPPFRAVIADVAAPAVPEEEDNNFAGQVRAGPGDAHAHPVHDNCWRPCLVHKTPLCTGYAQFR